jgi:nitrite reductase/ring-hydroxylating ferredoxin subunit
VPEGSARGFDPAGTGRDTVFLVRRAGLRAYRDECPHWAGTPLPWRKDAYLNGRGTRIVCSAHGAQFEIETGMCVLGPCVGEALIALPVTVTPQGDVLIEIGDIDEEGQD